MGVLIVASAGNESGAVAAPGNCSGVLAVAGLRNVGTKVGYSSFGPEVGVAAPAGNCVDHFARLPEVHRHHRQSRADGAGRQQLHEYDGCSVQSRHQLLRAHRLRNRRADARGQREFDAAAADRAHRIERHRVSAAGRASAVSRDRGRWFGRVRLRAGPMRRRHGQCAERRQCRARSDRRDTRRAAARRSMPAAARPRAISRSRPTPGR